MNSSPLVSVAIPAYKATYLRETIDCILNQTYKNIELIVVDDNSPYGIKDIVSQYNDERISYYRNPKNLGKGNPVPNWNKCLSYAKGEFFCLICDDDLYAPDFIETMLGLADKFPDCHVFRARAHFIDKEGKETDKYSTPPEWESMDDYLWHAFKGFRSQTISEFFYRTKRIKECGGYAIIPLAWYADYLSIFEFSKEGGIASTYRTLVSFRLSGENISSQDNQNIITKIEATNEFVDKVTRLIHELPQTDFNRDYLVGLLHYRTRINTKWSLRHARIPLLLRIWSRKKELRVNSSTLFYALFHPLK